MSAAPPIPMIVIIVPVEGKAIVRLSSASFEEELRLVGDLWGGNEVLLRIAVALEAVRRQLEEEAVT